MKKTLLGLALATGLMFSNIAFATDYNFAVVDVQKVVNASAEVSALRKQQETQMKELQQWLNNVKADIAKQQTKEGKQKLLKKYDAEFAKKQDTIKKNYASKLQEIDKHISATIEKEAKAKKYDMVFSKGIVLYGGKDITADIVKVVK